MKNWALATLPQPHPNPGAPGHIIHIMVEERIGYPVSDQFHAGIYSALSQLQSLRCIVSLEALKFDPRYSLLHRNDYLAICAFQRIYKQLYDRSNPNVYAITPPTKNPGPRDYAYQMAAFYFCYSHPYYGDQFRRLLDQNFCARVMESHNKFLRFQRMHPMEPSQLSAVHSQHHPVSSNNNKWSTTNAVPVAAAVKEMGPDVLRAMIEGGGTV